jgi:hypothetical protein
MPLINGVTPLLGFLLLEDSKKDVDVIESRAVLGRRGIII